MTLLSLMPQIHFWLVRGSQWQGAYATFQGDEFLYSTYINALIDGRPRRNDPPAGLDDNPQSPLPESLFSIQFIPPFLISFFARLFGASASTAFIVLAGMAGLLTSLSLYWLLTTATGDMRLAAVGTLVVLCFGTLAAGQGLMGMFFKPLETMFLGLPFLRRYVPSAAFPLFFVFCTLAWKSLSVATDGLAKVLMAGAVLCLLVFSYFYLWTAAVAWLFCVVVLWFCLRPNERSNISRLVLVTGPMLIIALGYYASLLYHRSPNVDAAQILTLTRQPDLFRIPEIIGFFILVLLYLAVRRNRALLNNPSLILAASFALLPIVVFNQQVITGRSLQPYHYEVFVTNYAVLIGLMLAAKLLYKRPSRRFSVLVIFFCVLWGSLEVNLPFQARSTSDVSDDETVPVLLRLKELARYDGTWEGLRNSGKTQAVAFSPEIGVMRLLSTWAPQGSLAEMGSGSFRTPSREQRKRNLFAYLYYSTANGESLRRLLNGGSGDGILQYYAQAGIFGPERLFPLLTRDFRPISNQEIENEVRDYEVFIKSFSRDEVLKRPLTYLITFTNNNRDWSHIDLWYKRDSGEQVGIYTLYRLELRN